MKLNDTKEPDEVVISSETSFRVRVFYPGEKSWIFHETGDYRLLLKQKDFFKKKASF